MRPGSRFSGAKTLLAEVQKIIIPQLNQYLFFAKRLLTRGQIALVTQMDTIKLPIVKHHSLCFERIL